MIDKSYKILYTDIPTLPGTEPEPPVSRVFITGLWLLAFNLLFATLAMMAMYITGLSWVLALAFIYLTLRRAWELKRKGFTTGQIAAAAFISQMPGLIFAVLALWSWYQWGPLTSDYDFLVQMWNAPLIPLLSIVPPIAWKGLAANYLAIFTLSPLMILIMTILASKTPSRTIR